MSRKKKIPIELQDVAFTCFDWQENLNTVVTETIDIINNLLASHNINVKIYAYEDLGLNGVDTDTYGYILSICPISKRDCKRLSKESNQ